VATAVRDADKVVGRYETTRRNESVLRVMAAFQDEDTVTAADDGTIEISSRLAESGVPKRWREVGPLVYRQIGGQAHVSFVAGPDGKVAYWISDDYPPAMVYERLHGIRGSGWLRPMLALSICMGLAVCGFAVLTKSRRGKLTGEREGHFRTASRVGFGIQTIVVLSWLLFVAVGLSDVVDGGATSALQAVSLFSMLAVGLTLVAFLPIAARAAVAVTRGGGGVASRVGEVVGLLAAVYLVWFMADYGLIAWPGS
jgi:hypothetical protein